MLKILNNSKDNSVKDENGITTKFGEKTIIFLPGCKWYNYYQRPQGMFTALSKSLPDWDFIFCDLGAEQPIKNETNNLFIVSNDWFEQTKSELYHCVFCTTVPWKYDEILNARGRWFDFVDDPKIFYQDEDKEKYKVLRDTKNILNIANITTCSSQRLISDFSKYSANKITLLKNAANPENTHLPSFTEKTSVVIGFWGFRGPWVNTELLIFLAERFPVLLAGAVIPESKTKTVGILPYNKLKDFAKKCTHLIIPFRDNRVTYYANPLKYYEYLYSNRVLILPERLENRTPERTEIIYTDNNWDKLENDINNIKFWDNKDIPFELHSWETRAKKFIETYIK